MVLEPRPGIFLVPLLVPGLWLEVSCANDAQPTARWLFGKRVLRCVNLAQA